MSAQLISPEDAGEPDAWELKDLKPIHKQVCSLAAQGVRNVKIAELVGITPEYVHVLLKQPVCREYVAKMNAAVGVQLEAMFQQTVEVISGAMQNGNVGEQLKGARLQLEATKRIGSGSMAPQTVDATTDRLALLAERLVGLLANKRGSVIDGDFKTVQETNELQQFRLQENNFAEQG